MVGTQVSIQARRPWVRLAVMGLAAWLFFKRDISLDISINQGSVSWPAEVEQVEAAYEPEPTVQPVAHNVSQLVPVKRVANVSQLVRHEPTAAEPAPRPEPKPKPRPRASTQTTTQQEREADLRRRQLAYVRKYHHLAKEEMEKYGIPASVTLAQGLLESNIGASRLATENNNHFGIKCFSRSCRTGHCSNHTDDSHKDFFRIYGTARESYRAHSHLLRQKRYRHLFSLGRTNYRDWAYGLRKAGYATDKKYAEKLIGLIEALDLHQYDR